MNPPVQVLDPDPSVVGQAWRSEEDMWEALNINALGNDEFRPITSKAMYILGVIYCIFQSVEVLLKGPIPATYLPAFGVFASGIDLFGRCIQGNNTSSTKLPGSRISDLHKGFSWLANSYFDGRVTNDIIKTNKRGYSINDLIALRHFAAHGQATSRYDLNDIDYDILVMLKPIANKGLDRYWEKLKAGDIDLSNKLAKANIMGFRSLPLRIVLELFSRDPNTGKYYSVESIFDRFNWEVRI